MTIVVNFLQSRAKKRAETLHNVASVESGGPDAVDVYMEFTDTRHTFYDVASISVTPYREDEDESSQDKL